VIEFRRRADQGPPGGAGSRFSGRHTECPTWGRGRSAV